MIYDALLQIPAVFFCSDKKLPFHEYSMISCAMFGRCSMNMPHGYLFLSFDCDAMKQFDYSVCCFFPVVVFRIIPQRGPKQ